MVEIYNYLRIYADVDVVIRKYKILSVNIIKIMAKGRKEISLDLEVIKVIDEKTKTGELCLSRFINTALRDRYKDDLPKDQKKR